MKREKNISRKVALNLWLPIIVVVFILVAALTESDPEADS